jgi:SHAQKYF class myb-like DNA-binding protein
MSSPAPVPDPTAALPPPPPPVVSEQTAVATAAAVAANAVPGGAAAPQDTLAKRVAASVATVVPAPIYSSAAAPTSKSSKSKKKKAHVTVTMATAATAQAVGHGALGENTGRWTAEEHRLFLQGLEQHGKGWKKIASLIKSRTVVQIRTHAQKYFQKLSKARQNGDEGEVSMEGRGGPTSVPSVTNSAAQSSKRRRQTSGTKRKAIQSVVSSAQRQGKKIAAAQAASGTNKPVPHLPGVAPALSPYVLPASQPLVPEASDTQPSIPSFTTAQGSFCGPALEDSL